MTYLLIVLFILPTYVAGLFGSKKNITVIGHIDCGEKGYSGVTVTLWEDDLLNFDDKLDSTHTNSTGHFHLFGETREIRNIEPYITIKHSCNSGHHDVRCLYTDRYNVPKSYQGMTYNFGNIELSTATMKRKSKCY
ncbi:unnamed protein product [Thelazia callipaeda]|uniref:Transthyretin-like family-containing protein n=1 Tax=Thelazia callipaeda TaxID=103827 RepID=A0A0N5CRS1_THECL|nr:unnamed protein product [Thelazia callipaeda]